MTVRLDAAAPVTRFDVGRLGRVERTPIGGIRVDARVSRSGILEYVDAAGNRTREYRPDAEAFAVESMATLRDAAVTVGHPSDGRMVSPETAKRDSVGHVRDPGRRDGAFVLTSLAIDDGATIRKVDAGELVEISAGYTCTVDPTPGVTPDGEKYDAIQRGPIVYNHVALLPRGGGRAGSQVALRLDARAATAEIDDSAPRARNERIDSMKTERIDGIEYEVGTVAWSQARAAHQTKLDADRAAMVKELEETKTKADAMKAALDEANGKIKGLEETLATETSEAKTDARVTARLALLETARTILGADVKFDGKTADAIKREIVTKLDGAERLNGSDGKPRSVDQMAQYFDMRMQVGTAVTPPKLSPMEEARKLGGGNPHLDAAAVPASFFAPNLADKWKH